MTGKPSEPEREARNEQISKPRPRKHPDRRTQSRAVDLPAEQIVREYREGSSLAKIAAAHGTSDSTVGKLLDSLGVERRPRSWKLGTYDRSTRSDTDSLPAEQIISEYKGGATLAKLAEAYEVSNTAIVNLLKAHGVERRSSRDVTWKGRSRVLTEEQEKQIITLYREGTSQRKLAHDFGVSRPVIAGVLQRHGMSPAKAPDPKHE